MLQKVIITDGRSDLRNMRRTSADYYKYLVINMLLILLFVACERDIVVVPHDLVGKWKTSAPQYADRYMKFSEHTVIYGVGDGEEVSHTIDKIVMKQGVDGIVYIFSYRDAEGEQETLAFTYRPASGGTLQLKHSKEIWEKDRSGDAR